MIGNVVDIRQVVVFGLIYSEGLLMALQDMTQYLLLVHLWGEHAIDKVEHGGILVIFLKALKHIDCADVDVAVSEISPEFHIHFLQVNPLVVDNKILAVVFVHLQNFPSLRTGDVHLAIPAAVPDHRCQHHTLQLYFLLEVCGDCLLQV